jgi:hypothetical protein
MSTTSTSSARPGARGIQVALALVALVAALFVGSSPASADPAVTLLDGSLAEIEDGLVVDEQEIHVNGSGFTPGNWAYVAVCNFTAGGYNGTHCNGASGAWEAVQIDGSGNFAALVQLFESFDDFNFQTGMPQFPPSETICWLAEDWTGLCQVQVVEYTSSPPSGPPVQFVPIDLHF